MVNHTPGLAIVKAYIREADRPLGDSQVRGVRDIFHRDRPDDHFHAVLQGAHVAKQPVQLTQHPVEHQVQAQNEPKAKCHVARCDQPLLPERQGQPGNCHDHRAAEGHHHRAHGGKGSRKDAQPVHEGFVAAARSLLLILGATEELHCLDVGVCVDQTARNRRPGARDIFGSLPDPWDKVPGNQRETSQPDDDCCAKPPVERADQKERRQRIDEDVPDSLKQVDHEVARGLAALPDLRGNTAGEFIVKIGQALSHHLLMRLPSHEVEKARDDHLFFDKGGQDRNEGPDDKDDEGHGEKRAAMGREKRFSLIRLQHVDDGTDERIDGGLHRSRKPAQHQHRDEGPSALPDKVEKKRKASARGGLLGSGCKWIDPCLENAVQGLQIIAPPGRRPLVF